VRVTARWPRVSTGIAAIGAVLCIIGLVVDPARTASAYLVAYASALAVVLGALAMIMIARVTAATWFVALRRQAEQIVATLPAFALLLIPLLAATRLLYSWTDVEGRLEPASRAAVHAKGAYLNAPFFVVRAVVYMVVWIVLGEALRRTSLGQDRGDSPAVERRMRTISAVGLVAFAITLSFAAFDWMMSLRPTWYSTIYGVDYFAGAMVGALALLAVLIARGRWRGELPEAVGADHLHALAKLLITFVLFWVYIGFSQFIVIWSAEIPVERAWYVARTRGAWNILAAWLIGGHFIVPFLVLLVRDLKRSTFVMALLGAWLLSMHYLDIYWIVMPDAPRGNIFAPWLDLGALMFVAGVASATWSIRRAGEPSVVRGDPRVAASLAYSTE
jgi:hypothetical protein